MRNATKKAKSPNPHIAAVVRKAWGVMEEDKYTYMVQIVSILKKDRGTIEETLLKNYHLGDATRREAYEARRNLLSLYLLNL